MEYVVVGEGTRRRVYLSHFGSDGCARFKTGSQAARMRSASLIGRWPRPPLPVRSLATPAATPGAPPPSDAPQPADAILATRASPSQPTFMLRRAQFPVPRSLSPRLSGC